MANNEEEKIAVQTQVVRDLESKLSQKRTEFRRLPEVRELNKKHNRLSNKYAKLGYNIQDKINEQGFNYQSHSGTFVTFDPKNFKRTSLNQSVIAAIEEVIGDKITKLRKSDVETIIRTMIEQDGKEVTKQYEDKQREVQVELQKVIDRYNQLEKETIGDLPEKIAAVKSALFELKKAYIPPDPLVQLRTYATSPEGISKIRQRCAELAGRQ